MMGYLEWLLYRTMKMPEELELAIQVTVKDEIRWLTNIQLRGENYIVIDHCGDEWWLSKVPPCIQQQIYGYVEAELYGTFWEQTKIQPLHNWWKAKERRQHYNYIMTKDYE